MALRLMHELRKLLGFIDGFSKKIATVHYADDKLAEYTGIIFKEAKRLDMAFSELLVQVETTTHKA
jgi:nitrogen-specific signal transduction histidine kinase